MPLYDVNGNQVSQLFDIHGNSVARTYSVDGTENDPIVPFEPFRLVVMTYNVNWWSEKTMNGSRDRLDRIFDKYDPDILGIQEHLITSVLECSNGTDKPIGDYLAERFTDVELGGKTHSSGNYMNVVASKHELKDATTDYFTVGGLRNYQKMYIEHGGVKIAVFNTHLYWADNPSNGYGAETRWEQAKQLFAAVQKEKYAIVLGDFNVIERNEEFDDYENIIEPFVDAGYNCANPNYNGEFLYTCFEDEDDDGVLEVYPTDSIITSPNIQIDRVIVDYTKTDDEYPGISCDHTPLIAYITVT